MACSDSSLIFISSNTPSAVLTRIQIIKERLSEKRSELENVLELQDRLAKRYNKVHEEVHHSLTWLIRIDRELRRHGVMSTWEDMVKNHKRFIKLEEKEMTFYKDLFKKDVFEPKNILKMEIRDLIAQHRKLKRENQDVVTGKSKDNTEVDESEDDTDVNESEDNTDVDDSEDNMEVDASEDNTEVGKSRVESEACTEL